MEGTGVDVGRRVGEGASVGRAVGVQVGGSLRGVGVEVGMNNEANPPPDGGNGLNGRAGLIKSSNINNATRTMAITTNVVMTSQNDIFIGFPL